MSNLRAWAGRLKRNLRRRLQTLKRDFPLLPSYLYHVRWRLGVRKTKYDITFCVFKESYVGDQYGIREFADKMRGQERLVMFDLGRNHGLVLLFLVDYLTRSGSTIRRIDYVGIEPSPLKFAYHKNSSIQVHYRLIDKAIIYDDQESILLKYGDDNFGNFNVSGSNYEGKQRRKLDFIELEVDTMAADDVIDMVRRQPDEVPLIVKIDFKYRCSHFFEMVAKELSGRKGPLLLACEEDGTAEGDIAQYANPVFKTLVLMRA